MKDFEHPVYAKGLEQRKSWYSSVAKAYDRARPRYPEEIIDRAVELAGLSDEARILEVGCGPGTATTAFARRGFAMVCLEPSLEACQLARWNCEPYPEVKIVNTTFEEWKPGTEKFDAVLAASAFHWVSSETGYPKAADALKDGPLILLWNTPPQPGAEASQALKEVYEARAPSIPQPENEEAQTESLREFGQAITDSGRFGQPVFEKMTCKASYNIEDYLALLSTLSPYIALNPQERNFLFEGLRQKLESICEGSLPTSFTSALHIARKATASTKSG